MGYKRVADMTPEEHAVWLARASARAKAWRQANPERARAITRRASVKRREAKRAYDKARYQGSLRQKKIDQAVAWRKDRRRDFAYKVNQKARKYGLPDRLDWRDLVYGDCAYCGTPCQSWDHVIPMSRGGANTLDNLVPACWPCNSWKKNKTIEEWAAFVFATKAA